VKGSAAIEEFADARASINHFGIGADEFYSLVPTEDGSGGKKAIVKNSVGKWISDLKTHPGCSDTIADLLILIETQLVAESTQRSNAIEIVASLSKIIEREKTDAKYLCKMNAPLSPPMPYCTTGTYGKLERHSTSRACRQVEPCFKRPRE
jgi:hypothetical protein